MEFESAVTMVVKALVALKSPHAIDGLYRWCRNVVGPQKKHMWSWMKGAQLVASGRLILLLLFKVLLQPVYVEIFDQ